jgi:pimeloyl-ACP methyl ester carboxylesterase
MERAYYRELGAGPTVLCIHPSSSSSAQWKPLMARLSSRYRVVAVDIYGHGRSPRWENRRDLTLADEVELIAPVLPESGPVVLVGHSYGAAVALELALTYPDRVAALALYEPASWGLLVRERPRDPATREILALREDTDRLVRRGRPADATRLFLTYWAGAGAWEALPDDRRRNLVAGVDTLPHGWAAAFGEGPTMTQLATIRVPCLLLSGERTRRPAAAVARLLERGLPTVATVALPGLGHLGPLTDPSTVDAEIEAFLASSTS